MTFAIDKEKSLILFANCKVVVGAKQATINDLLLGSIYPIPLSLASILINFQRKQLKCIYKEFSQDEDTLNEYFDFLLSEQLIYLTDEVDNFPDIGEDWLLPNIISNCIIDVDSNSHHVFDRIFQSLSLLNCKYIQVRVFDLGGMRAVKEIVDNINGTTIHAIELIVPFSEELNENAFLDLIESCDRIVKVVVFSSRINSSTETHNLITPIIYTTKNVAQEKFCGKIHVDNFGVNLLHFNESLHHNTCLNRKISIDINGNIKNCPSMKESFGNIKDITLQEAINKPGFKKYWNIKKDEITKCKDCEFRHVCTDCRAYRENPDDIHSAPLKCGYDPYTCEWEEWSISPLKQKAIDYYGMQEIIKDNE